MLNNCILKLAIGETFHCSGCWKNHTAGVDVNLQTYVGIGDGELDYRGMPKDAQEKADWIAEAELNETA